VTRRSARLRFAARFLCVLALANAVWAGAVAARLECPVSFFVNEQTSPVALRLIDFGVSYAPPSLVFPGSGMDVECTNQEDTAVATFDDDDRGRLDAVFLSDTGIPTLFELLAVCRVRSDQLPGPGSITVVDLVEEDMAGQPVSIPVQILFPTPEDCVTLPTTTSSTSTTTTTTTTTTTPAGPSCGDPTGDGQVTATDALLALNASVGLASCALCLCDVNDDGVVSATDSLMLLNVAVGQPLSLTCPPC
jgi:hypothetical protein